MSKIYFVIDEKKRVFPCCDWTPDIKPSEDWVIGEMAGNAYDDKGIPQWKYSNGSIKKRTAEEIKADIDVMPTLELTPLDVLRADVDYLLMLSEEE